MEINLEISNKHLTFALSIWQNVLIILFMHNAKNLTKQFSKGLPISIYKAKGFPDCSNNGISNNFDTVLVPCEGGFYDVKKSDLPVVDIFERNLFGKKVLFFI